MQKQNKASPPTSDSGSERVSEDDMTYNDAKLAEARATATIGDAISLMEELYIEQIVWGTKINIPGFERIFKRKFKAAGLQLIHDSASTQAKRTFSEFMIADVKSSITPAKKPRRSERLNCK